MDTKQYLGQIRRLDMMINNKIDELSVLKDMARSISAVKNEERVQSSPNFDKIGDTLCKISEMETEIDNLIDEYVDKKKIISSQIECISNDACYNVLYMRYINMRTFENIADKMNYSFRQVMRIHKRALREFETCHRMSH